MVDFFLSNRTFCVAVHISNFDSTELFQTYLARFWSSFGHKSKTQHVGCCDKGYLHLQCYGYKIY